MRIKILVFLFLISNSFSFGQLKEYNFKREIKGISDQWDKITLHNDIRIYGITPEKDMTIMKPDN